MSESFTKTLAAFAAADIKPTELASKIACLSALDWLTCGFAGRNEPVAQIIRRQALADGGHEHSCLFGGGLVPARAAALVNGTVSHALDYDDTHFAHIGHPSVAIFPAAFAIGEKKKCSLPDVLSAGLIGMEASIRVGLWLGRSHYQAGFHQTATAGAFGALIAAGRLLKFDATQYETGLGLAATRATGLKAQFGTMGKPYNAGLAAATGVEVAELVALGFDAAEHALEGPLGFGATHDGEGNQEGALADLGRNWHIEQVSHKFHACCHGLHAALEAMRSLEMAEPEIARIDVATHPRWMTVCNQQEPTTGLGAKFSYRVVLAMQILGHDTARLESYGDDALFSAPKLTSLRDRIHVTADDALAETEARVSVLRRDGQRFEARHDLNQEQEYSQREERVLQKARALLGARRAEETWLFLKHDQELEGMIGRLMGG